MSERVVLAQKAYILFYIRKEGSTGDRENKPAAASSSQAPTARLQPEPLPAKRPAATQPAEPPLHKRPFEARPPVRPSDSVLRLRVCFMWPIVGTRLHGEGF